MPSQQEVQWSQLKVGILVIAALAVLTILVFLMSGGTGGLFAGKLTVRSYFENASGIKVGAPVNLEGVTIGNVKSVRISTDADRRLTPVEVTMQLSKTYVGALHADSKTSLETIGVLGDTVVDIDSKHANGPALTNNAVLATNESPSLSDVIKSSQGTIEQLNTILAKVDKLADSLNSSNGSIGALINSPELYTKAITAVNQILKLSDQLANGNGSIGKLLTDETLYNRANATVARLESIASDLDKGNGTAGKLLKDDKLYNNLNDTVTKADSLITDINAGKGSLGKLAKDQAFANKLDETVTRLDSILNQVDTGKGTIGQLVQNPKLYDDADKMINDTGSLVTAIRQDPKKYLVIHFKIF